MKLNIVVAEGVAASLRSAAKAHLCLNIYLEFEAQKDVALPH